MSSTARRVVLDLQTDEIDFYFFWFFIRNDGPNDTTVNLQASFV
jgi:hypothetical protein